MLFAKFFRKKKRVTNALTYDLTRFVEAQDKIYHTVIKELKNAYKFHHWMWYIFPQFDGLAITKRSEFYAIKSQEEAKAYLAHPILKERLEECCQLLLDIENKSIDKILGYPDNLKLNSSMTLFYYVSKNELFQKVLNKYFDAKEDIRTIELIEKSKNL